MTPKQFNLYYETLKAKVGELYREANSIGACAVEGSEEWDNYKVLTAISDVLHKEELRVLHELCA